MPTPQLKPSPIQLLSQDIIGIHLNAHLDGSGFGESRLSVDREISPADNDERVMALFMRVTIHAAEESTPPAYTGHIELSGYYRVHENYESDPERLIRITGASMLYGVAREMVSAVTARGPHGLLTLPSVSFYEEAAKKKPAGKSAKRKSTKRK